jgi:hypothetical protein
VESLRLHLDENRREYRHINEIEPAKLSGRIIVLVLLGVAPGFGISLKSEHFTRPRDIALAKEKQQTKLVKVLL